MKNPQNLLQHLLKDTKVKVILCVIDGLGGIGRREDGLSELDIAKKDNIDELARISELGFLINKELYGISCGSGVGHLALFGYSPFEFELQRGLIEALGINYLPAEDEVVLRGNFAIVDERLTVTDRRAGRIDIEKNKELIKKIQDIKIDDVLIKLFPVAEHRVLIVLKGENLDFQITDTDPGTEGEKIKKAQAKTKTSQKTAEVINKFTEYVIERLSSQVANAILLRGAAKIQKIISFYQRYKLKPVCIAKYPMYKGISRLLNFDVIEVNSIKESFDALIDNFDREWDFYFLHVKELDSAGEDGDFYRRVKLIEEIDKHFKDVKRLKYDVLVVTADHCTPAECKAHSWHPIPILLNSKYCRMEGSGVRFSERFCKVGYLGFVDILNLMKLMLAHAKKLEKFGA